MKARRTENFGGAVRDDRESLAHRIKSRRFTVLVVGIGRVGLPLCLALADAGVKHVIGCDKNRTVVNRVREGTPPFKEEGLSAVLSRVLRRGNASFTADLSAAVKGTDVVIVSVGTPLTDDHRADISQVVEVVDQILPLTKQGALLVFRSTLVPGMTKGVIMPRVSKLARGRVSVLVCPERIVEGVALRELKELPEIMGGEDSNAVRAGIELFRLLGKKRIITTDFTTAETAKVFANIYRYVNFALANEFAILAETLKINGREAIEIANAGYKRGGIPLPGPSGGPCLYKDGHFLVSKIPYMDFIRMAWLLNEAVPQYIVSRLIGLSGSLYGRRVGVLGLTYKRDSDDTRYSPALKLVECLRSEGARVFSHDPFLKQSNDLAEVLNSEIVILACNHSSFDSLEPREFKAQYVFDCWGALAKHKDSFARLGIKYKEFGEG